MVRLGRSHLSCENVGCLELPSDDYATCAVHRNGIDELQIEINAAFKLLVTNGNLTGKYVRQTPIKLRKTTRDAHSD